MKTDFCQPAFVGHQMNILLSLKYLIHDLNDLNDFNFFRNNIKHNSMKGNLDKSKYNLKSTPLL